MIPKIFHLTAKTKNLSPSFQKNVERLQHFYPDYEVRIYDDGDLISFLTQFYPEYYETVLKKVPAFIMTVDTVRYLWMQHYGGVYCDMDINFERRYEIGGNVIFVEREWTWPRDDSIKTSVHNCWFGSVPGHPIWQDIIDGIRVNILTLTGRKQRPEQRTILKRLSDKIFTETGLQKPYQSTVFDVTGPNAISRIISEKNLLARYPDVTIASGDTIYQEGLSKGLKGSAYFVHETAGSWRS